MKESLVFSILLAGVCSLRAQLVEGSLAAGPSVSISQIFEYQFVSTSANLATGILYIDVSNPNIPAQNFSSYFEISDMQYAAVLFPNPPIYSKGAQVTYDVDYPNALFVFDQAVYTGGVQLSEFAGEQDWALYSGDNFSGPILESGTGFWQPVAVPEPGSLALVGLAGVAILMARRRKSGEGAG